MTYKKHQQILQKMSKLPPEIGVKFERCIVKRMDDLLQQQKKLQFTYEQLADIFWSDDFYPILSGEK